MLSDLLVMLFLLAMILFIVYHFYVDYSNWSNTGNTFAEGMTNQGENQYEYMQKRYCKSYDSYTRHNVPVSASQSKEKGCQMKCDEEGENCNTIAVGDGVYGGGPYNCTTYKNCALSAPGTSSSWTRGSGTTGGNYEYYKKNKVEIPTDEGGKQCAANFGTTTPSDGSNSGTVAAQYVCPQELPVCNDYKFQVKWGNCIAAPSNEGTCERNDPSKITAVSYNGGSFPWDSSKSQEWNVNNQKRICEQELGKCFKNWESDGKQGPWCYEKTKVGPNNLTPQEVMNRQTQARAGINNPMESSVPQNCKQGCVAPNGPNGNCENVTINGEQKKKCSHSCPVPTFIRGDTVNCKYDKDCNACEPKKIFAPDAPPDMPRSGRPVDGVANNSGSNSWVGSRIDVAGIQNAPGLNPGSQMGGQMGGQMGSQMGGQMGTQMGSQMGGQMGEQASGSAPANIVHANNALFNENIMTQVLASKNLIPEDIKIGQENQDNFIRVGMNFMQDFSHIRNISVPNIDNDDYESLGRVISKIKQQEMENITGPQSLVAKKELANSVKNILSGTMISNSQVDWDTPTDTAKITTTGMYGDNSNSKMGYGDRAKNHHREYPDGGLCLWNGCEKHQKGRAYDSVWSLY